MSNQNDPFLRINPRVRAYGKARLDIAHRAQSRQDWDTLWKKPLHEFPFTWGTHWKQCIEYRVGDYAAEVGFFIDILGLPVNAFNEYSAMFTGPAHEFFFTVTPTFEGQEPTSPGSLRMQFFVADIYQVAEELTGRGIQFEQPPQPVADGSNYHVGTFRTPNGIAIDLCGLVDEPAFVVEEDQSDRGDDEAEEDGGPILEDSSEVYRRLGTDPDDVFVEVIDQPGAARSNKPRQQTGQATRPVFQSSHQPDPAQRRTNPPAHLPQRPSEVEPTYEPVDENATGQTPSKPAPQPRTYRAIPFNEDLS